ncbi:MAG TPA: DedA family protein [Actinomycetota bacterium]|nr:DedA family protein [Actinomycetota bacterium]
MLALTLVERIVSAIEPYFLAAGYFIIAGGVLMERSVFIGLIIPGDFILALGGVYASQNKMDLSGVIVVGCVAAICGESIGFWLGRKFGLRVVRHFPYIGKWLAEKIEASEDFFRRHGGKTVAIGRYATAAGAFIPFSAGAARMKYWRFLAFDVPAIIVWATGISIFGYVFGENLALVDRVLSRFGYIVLGLIVVLFLGRWLWKRWRGEPGQAKGS